ncbi:MAG: hypothetical protein JWP38_2083 [Herbaspirillum sp.]|nr:hypothetical protein [Herbaspirillum sp.]
MEGQAATPRDISSCAVAVRDTQYRIDAPNSSKRFLEVVGIGKGGERMGRVIKDRNLRDVHVVLDAAEQARGTGALELLDGADMLFIIACDGDDVMLAPFLKQAARRKLVPVTGILIQNGNKGPESAGLALLRASCDMLVIAASEDYVADMLVEFGA